MEKPLWSFVLIAKNEAQTLPKLMESLREFTARGGQTVIVDTGSTDGTIEVAKGLSCTVYEEGARFVHVLGQELADNINHRFVVDGEEDIVSASTALFDYSAARNYAASKSPTDVIAMPDCDEVWTRLDIDKVNEAIRSGAERLEYNFVFSHDQYGQEAIKFMHSKFYDRRKIHWEGIVHELLCGACTTKFLDESVMKLEHWQNPASNRSGYLPGLALDCFEHPDKDRNSHYFAREMMFNGRYKSAIKEFDRHVTMNRWLPEMAQSVIYIGDCHLYLGNKEQALENYFKAFRMDGSRREALLRIADIYYKEHDHQRTAAFAAAALTVPWNNFYCNVMSDYTYKPHELLYCALWWIGDREGSKEHWKKAFAIQPFNPKYVHDGQFYLPYPESGVEGWMRLDECNWLFEMAQKMRSVAEVGSWKGRSTHALCSGCTDGVITAIDHFKGSVGEEAVHAEAKDASDPVYKQFLANTQKFKNLEINRCSSLEAAPQYEDKHFDAVFIDGDHNYEAVKLDIEAWKPKARLLLCGHDYTPEWPGVRRAVQETVGDVQVCGTIWFKWLVNPMVSIVIPTLGRPEKLDRLLRLIRENAGYSNYEVIVKCDQMPPHNRGVPFLLKEGVAESKGELVMYLGNDCVPEKNFLLLAVLDMATWFPDMDGLVGLNDDYWLGEMATHWLASKKLLPYLDGEFFHTGYAHAGCDNELTERCRKLHKYGWSERARVKHDHPIVTGFRPEQLDEVHRVAYSAANLHHDRTLLHRRSQMLGFALREASIMPVIPRQIFSIWLNADPKIPELVRRCLKTHAWPGYKHRVINLRNCFRESAYVQRCLELRQWARAADYLRAYYLYTEGGIYLDADMELLNDLDNLLTLPLVCEREDNGFIANSFIVGKKGHPILKAYLDRAEQFEIHPTAKEETWHNGMGAWTVILQDAVNDKRTDVNVLDIGAMHGTLIHHFTNSWTNPTDSKPA